MPTRLIPLTDLSGRHLAAWQRLAAYPAEPNPFYEPYFVLAAIRRSGAAGAHLLVVERDGDWIACLPVRQRGAAPFTALQSWCDEYFRVGTPLVDRHSVGEAVEALLDVPGLLVLERVVLDGPVGDALRELAEVVERLPEAPPREPAGVEVRDRSADPEAIDELLRLEPPASPADEEFIRQIATAFGNEGRLEVLELPSLDGPPLAIACNLRAGGAEFGLMAAGEADRLLPDRPKMATLVVGPSGVRGAIARGAARAALAVRAA